MFDIGDIVTIKVRNALYDVRHRYANGYVGPEFQEYTGTIMREKWFSDDEIGLTSDTPGIKIRRINKSRIVEVNTATFDYTPVKSSRETIVVQGSKGNTYVVTKENGKVSCSCPGYSYRKSCRHIDEVM